MKPIVFIDAEIDMTGKKVLDLGAASPDGSRLHTASLQKFSAFISDVDYICGHNIIAHDLKYIGNLISQTAQPIPI